VINHKFNSDFKSHIIFGGTQEGPLALLVLISWSSLNKAVSYPFALSVFSLSLTSSWSLINSFMHELLVREAHGGSLMGHFGVRKTLDVLYEHFFLPKMKRDVERVCARCVTCRHAKFRVLPHGL